MPIINRVEKISDRSYEDEIYTSSMRVIADHIKAATFLIAEGGRVSNKAQGYVLRRLLRRAAVKMHLLKGSVAAGYEFSTISDEVLKMYEGIYFNFGQMQKNVSEIIDM